LAQVGAQIGHGFQAGGLFAVQILPQPISIKGTVPPRAEILSFKPFDQSRAKFL
jgi:hypothetical protein